LAGHRHGCYDTEYGVVFVTAAGCRWPSWWRGAGRLSARRSVLIETAPYVLRHDRVSSVDDVLVNTVGAVLAVLASRPRWRRV
jgi:hypothetical protein